MVNNKAINNFTGVQASGVIIDCLLRQCCFVWSKIIGPSLRKGVEKGLGIGRKGKGGIGERKRVRRSLPFSLSPSPLPLPFLRLPRRLYRTTLISQLQRLICKVL